MWRNVAFNPTNEPASFPEGMHKHETGAYFKTPSIQSAGSTQSGEARAATPTDEIEAGSARELKADEQLRAKQRRLKLKGRQLSANAAKANFGQPPATGPNAGFRSRLSSISGALQHPKLAKRLFSHHNNEQAAASDQQAQAPIQITTTSIDSPQHQASAANPNLCASDGHAQSLSDGAAAAPEQRLLFSSSGRRLSQLFLPQLATNPMLGQDPYTNNELIPPHLLGLYGQPPLVGGAASPGGLSLGAGAHRASWADISLLGRLSNVRPSVDSAFHSTQMRHSFDARK